jgi:hypothetical protein
MTRHLTLTLLILSFLFAACTGSSRRAAGRTEGMNPGECSDGADNDGDRYFDCDDSDCAGAPVCGGMPSDGGPSDSAVVFDTSTPSDSGRDTSTPPADTGTDTRVDTSTPTCTDVSGDWENATLCELLPEGELFTITSLGSCMFSFTTSSGLSGTGTVSGSEVTIDITSPVAVSCMGTYSGGVIYSDCLGCMLELWQL